MTLDDIKKMGFEDPESTFSEIALVGGFGKILPSTPGGLDIESIVDPAAKAAVNKILSRKQVKNDAVK